MGLRPKTRAGGVVVCRTPIFRRILDICDGLSVVSGVCDIKWYIDPLTLAPERVQARHIWVTVARGSREYSNDTSAPVGISCWQCLEKNGLGIVPQYCFVRHLGGGFHSANSLPAFNPGILGDLHVKLAGRSGRSRAHRLRPVYGTAVGNTGLWDDQ